MIRLASETSSIELAWTAYDEAMLRLHAAYQRAAPFPQDRMKRMAMQVECEQLLKVWRDLYYGVVANDPRPAA